MVIRKDAWLAAFHFEICENALDSLFFCVMIPLEINAILPCNPDLNSGVWEESGQCCCGIAERGSGDQIPTCVLVWTQQRCFATAEAEVREKEGVEPVRRMIAERSDNPVI